MSWFTTGIQVNPIVDFILADTGALSGSGQSNITAILSSTIGGGIVLEQRDSTNTSNISSHILVVNANTTLQFEFPGVVYSPSQRFRLRCNTALVGQIQGSVFVF